MKESFRLGETAERPEKKKDADHGGKLSQLDIGGGEEMGDEHRGPDWAGERGGRTRELPGRQKGTPNTPSLRTK